MQLYNIIINNLLRRKAKMFFVLIGLSIGIATVVSVYGIVETMKTEMTRQVSEFGVNVVLTPDAGGLTFSYGGITLPEIMYDVENLTEEDVDIVRELTSKDMIKVISPKLLGTGTVKHNKVIIVGANLQDEFLIKPWLKLSDENSEDAVGEDTVGKDTVEEIPKDIDEKSGEKKMEFEALDLARQSLEGLKLQDNQVIVGYDFAKGLNIKTGDLLKIHDKEFEVYGTLVESGSVEDKQVLMNLNPAQEALGSPGEITVIDMAVDYLEGSEETLLTEIGDGLPHVKVTSLRQETLRRDEVLVRLVRFGVTLSIIILLVGMLVVALTMSNSVRERTREIGIFRAIGFRQYHIIKMVMLEGLIISVIGGMVGYVGGILMARYAGPFISGMEIIVPWRVDLLLISIGLAVVIGILSSIYPAYQAVKQDPAESLRFI